MRHRLAYEVSPPLAELIFEKTGGNAESIDGIIGMIQRQKPPITTLSQNGVVHIDPDKAKMLSKMSWLVRPHAPGLRGPPQGRAGLEERDTWGAGGGGGVMRYANYWAAKTVKRPPQHPAQPRYTNYWAPRTRKRHPQEHRLQRPTERSDPTQHAKGRTGDCPGPRKGTATRRNVTRAVTRG